MLWLIRLLRIIDELDPFDLVEHVEEAQNLFLVLLPFDQVGRSGLFQLDRPQQSLLATRQLEVRRKVVAGGYQPVTELSLQLTPNDNQGHPVLDTFVDKGERSKVEGHARLRREDAAVVGVGAAGP